MKRCEDCEYLRTNIKNFDIKIPGKYGDFTSPCNRYPRNIMRSPKEPACGEFKAKEK